MKKITGFVALAMVLLFVSSCKDKKEVISGEITAVTILSFPETDADGDQWDFDLIGSENPDLEVQFNRGASISNDPIGSSERYDDVTNADGPFTFDEFDAPWLLDVLTDDYTVAIYDYDVIGSDQMATFTFNANDYTDDAPSSVTISNGSSSISINIMWTFAE